MQEHMSNISGQIQTLRKNQKERLEINNTVKKLTVPFMGSSIDQVGMVEERISEPKEMSIKTSKTEMQDKKE